MNEQLLSELEKKAITDFAELSKYLRKKQNLSQIELAEKFRKSKCYATYIAFVETDRRTPSPKMLEEYSHYFKIGYNILVKYALNSIRKSVEIKIHNKIKSAENRYKTHK